MNWPQIYSDIELVLEASSFEPLYVDRFTLSTSLIPPNFRVEIKRHFYKGCTFLFQFTNELMGMRDFENGQFIYFIYLNQYLYRSIQFSIRVIFMLSSVFFFG